MRRYEKKTETITTNNLVETTCDLCNAIAKQGCWESSIWDVNESEVSISITHKDGTQYPEGGSGTSMEVDICPKCFKEVLVPFLKSKGANIEEKTWDTY
jgi:hypothetical protein